MQNPMREALENWERLQSDLMMAKDESRELNSCNSKLLAEVDYLREKLEQVSLERDRYKSYAIDITSRLSVIKDTIITAEAGAREYALKPPIPTQGAEMTPQEAQEVEQLVARLPVNALR